MVKFNKIAKENKSNSDIDLDLIELTVLGYSGDEEDPDGLYTNYSISYDKKKIGNVDIKSWDDGSALIDRIDIDEEFRNKGIGSYIISYFSDLYSSCYIVPDNTYAQRLYARLGSETTEYPWYGLDQGYGVYKL